MDTTLKQDLDRLDSHVDAERQRQIKREAAILAKAHADIDAGLGIEDDDMRAWLDRLDHDESAPMPGNSS